MSNLKEGLQQNSEKLHVILKKIFQNTDRPTANLQFSPIFCQFEMSANVSKFILIPFTNGSFKFVTSLVDIASGVFQKEKFSKSYLAFFLRIKHFLEVKQTLRCIQMSLMYACFPCKMGVTFQLNRNTLNQGCVVPRFVAIRQMVMEMIFKCRQCILPLISL